MLRQSWVRIDSEKATFGLRDASILPELKTNVNLQPSIVRPNNFSFYSIVFVIIANLTNI